MHSYPRVIVPLKTGLLPPTTPENVASQHKGDQFLPYLSKKTIFVADIGQGWGYTAQGDHSNQTCGIEVVLPDGTLVRTGMRALDNSACGPLLRGGFGPT